MCSCFIFHRQQKTLKDFLLYINIRSSTIKKQLTCEDVNISSTQVTLTCENKNLKLFCSPCIGPSNNFQGFWNVIKITPIVFLQIKKVLKHFFLYIDITFINVNKQAEFRSLTGYSLRTFLDDVTKSFCRKFTSFLRSGGGLATWRAGSQPCLTCIT